MKRVTGLNSLPRPIANAPNIPQSIFAGRVVYSILNNQDYPNLFNQKDGWASIGGIFFERMGNSTRSIDREAIPSQFARPLNPNVKHIPLENEIVYIISLPSSNSELSSNEEVYYYFNPINIWNSNHQNAIPNFFDINKSPSYEKRNYNAASNGVSRQSSNSQNTLTFGKTFKEKTNIKSLQPFEGDIIFEGRFGQSLRLGSTNYNSPIPNPWSNNSETEDNGNPITILRNSQHSSDNDPWIPQIENINGDGASIYLTSNQKIPIEVGSKSYKSYFGLSPVTPKNYIGSQVILTSSRLLFNSTSDSILLSSANTINLNSKKSVNIDTVENFSVFVPDNGKIFLGGNTKKNIEPVILGNRFLDDIKKLAEILVNLGNNLQLNPMLVELSKSNAELLGIGGNLKSQAQDIINNIERYKSKTTFSKK